MAEEKPHTVMQRMARLGREEYEARAMSPAKALRLSLARAADRLFDLALAIGTVEQVEIGYGGLPRVLGAPGLLVLLDGADGSGGAMHVDPGLLTALIEMQTVGRVSGRRDEARTVTRTDAAIAAPLIDGTLERVDACMLPEHAEAWTGGFRFGAMMEDSRSLILALNGVEFTCFTLMLEIGEEAYPGALTLLLPHCPAAPCDEPAAEGQTGAACASLADAVADAPVVLSAVLARMRLPLERVCALGVGDALPLPAGCLNEIRLEVPQRHVVASATMGQMNGARAVRVSAIGALDSEDERDPAPDSPSGNAAPRKERAHRRSSDAGAAPGAEVTRPEPEQGERADPDGAMQGRIAAAAFETG